MKRRFWKFALLVAVPLALYGYIAERNSWRPRVLAYRPDTLSFANGAVFSPDGSEIALVSSSSRTTSKINILRSSDLAVVATLPKSGYFPPFENSSLTYSRDQSLLATVDAYGVLRVWDRRHKKLLRTKNWPALRNIAFDSQNRLAVVSDDGTLRIWNVSSDRIESYVRIVYSGIRSVSFSPDGCFLAIAAGSNGWCGTHDWPEPAMQPIVSGPDTDKIFLWNCKQKRLIGALYGATTATFSHHLPLRLASGSDDGIIKLWDFKAQNPIGTWKRKYDNQLLKLHLSRYYLNRHAVSVGDNTELWDANAQKAIYIWKSKNAEQITNVVFSPDDKTVVATSSFPKDSGSISLYSTVGGKLERTIREPVTSVCYSVDGKSLLTSGLDGVKLWRIK